MWFGYVRLVVNEDLLGEMHKSTAHNEFMYTKTDILLLAVVFTVPEKLKLI